MQSYWFNQYGGSKLVGMINYHHCKLNIGEKIVTRVYTAEKKWCQIQILSDHFWKCWLHEYLLSLTLQSKRTTQKEQINTSGLALIKEDNVKRGQWPLGRVIEVHPKEDGVVRVVTVQTSKGTYKCPAVKIFPLENDGKFEVPQDGGNVR